MLKNPFINALAAAAYIAVLVFVMGTFTSRIPAEDTLFIPMAMLSLLVLSVALMAVLFFYEPARLFSQGEKEAALRFFLKTLASFAGFVVFFIALLLITPLL